MDLFYPEGIINIKNKSAVRCGCVNLSSISCQNLQSDFTFI